MQNSHAEAIQKVKWLFPVCKYHHPFPFGCFEISGRYKMSNDKNNTSSLSHKLEEIFEHTDKINESCQKIESCVNQEYTRLELLINPDKDADISKEIKFYIANFLQNKAKKL